MVRRAGAHAIWIVAAMLALSCGTAPFAHADGDPASDALISQSVFYPYSTSVPASARRALGAAVSRATRASAPVKVALIGHRDDLGSIVDLYGRPQRYARFLHTEISYRGSVRLIVVMPSGDGTAGLPASVARAIARLPPAGSASGAALTAAATRAVDVVAGAARGRGSSSTSRPRAGQGRTVLLLSLILAAILVSGAILLLRIFRPPPSAAASGGTHTGRAVGRRARPRARSRRRD